NGLLEIRFVPHVDRQQVAIPYHIWMARICRAFRLGASRRSLGVKLHFGLIRIFCGLLSPKARCGHQGQTTQPHSIMPHRFHFVFVLSFRSRPRTSLATPTYPAAGKQFVVPAPNRLPGRAGCANSGIGRTPPESSTPGFTAQRTGSTSEASISMHTDCASISTESTSLYEFFFRIKIPST